MLNRVIIIGRLVKDPVMRYLPSGSPIVEFPIVYSKRYMVNDTWKEESHFFDVKAYGKIAEGLTDRVSKGYMVVIEGKLTQERWIDKEGKTQSKVRIVADSVRIINKPKIEEPIEELPLKEEESTPEETVENPSMSDEDQMPF